MANLINVDHLNSKRSSTFQPASDPYTISVSKDILHNSDHLISLNKFIQCVSCCHTPRWHYRLDAVGLEFTGMDRTDHLTTTNGELPTEHCSLGPDRSHRQGTASYCRPGGHLRDQSECWRDLRCEPWSPRCLFSEHQTTYAISVQIDFSTVAGAEPVEHAARHTFLPHHEALRYMADPRKNCFCVANMGSKDDLG